MLSSSLRKPLILTLIFFGLLFFAVFQNPATALSTEFDYELTEEFATIIKYNGQGPVVDIPETIEGKPVQYLSVQLLGWNETVKELRIPKTIIGMDESFLLNAQALERVLVDPANETYMSTDGVLFNKEMSRLIRYPVKKEGSTYKIPFSVKEIGFYSFAYCTQLTNIELHSGIEAIGSGAFFATGIQTIHLPNSLTTIENDTFSGCRSLANIEIPETVQVIGSGAFHQCYSLETVVLPKGITFIGEDAFLNCLSLKSITIDPSNPYFATQQGVLLNDDLSTLIKFPESSAIVDYIVPKSVIQIADNAFYECRKLQSVELPSTLRRIGKFAFYTCMNVRSIHIPDSVIEIGEAAFTNCEALTAVQLSRNVSDLSPGLFSNCSNLVEITLPEGVRSIQQEFNNCYRLSRVDLPISLQKIDALSFQNAQSVQIIGYSSSYAERYAKSKALPFVTKGFVDMKRSDWYATDVLSLTKLGIFNGFSDSTFRGNAPVTVDQFIKLAISSLFIEVAPSSPYWGKAYLDKARELGLIDVNEYTTVEAGKNTITRAQMAKICDRLILQRGEKPQYTKTAFITELAADADLIQASGQSTAIYHMWEIGILQGFPDGRYGPNEFLTRAQAATVINRILYESARLSLED